jgi:hypothetical protein
VSWRTNKIATNRINVNRIKGNKASRVIRTDSLDNGNQARTRRTSRTLSKTLTGGSRAGPLGKMTTARAKVDNGENRDGCDLNDGRGNVPSAGRDLPDLRGLVLRYAVVGQSD